MQKCANISFKKSRYKVTNFKEKMRDISCILGQTKLLNVPLKIEHATQQIECNFKLGLQSLTCIFYLCKFLSY